MCSINDSINNVESSIKHLHSALAKLKSVPDKEAIEHNLYSDTTNILDDAATLDGESTEMAAVPEAPTQKAEVKKAPAKKKVAKKVVKNSARSRR